MGPTCNFTVLRRISSSTGTICLWCWSGGNRGQLFVECSTPLWNQRRSLLRLDFGPPNRGSCVGWGWNPRFNFARIRGNMNGKPMGKPGKSGETMVNPWEKPGDFRKAWDFPRGWKTRPDIIARSARWQVHGILHPCDALQAWARAKPSAQFFWVIHHLTMGLEV